MRARLMAKQSNIEVICITDEDCPRNEEFAELLTLVPNGRMIDFYTQDLEDLSVIAKHRVLPVPTFLFIHNNRAVGRIVHPPSAEHMADLLQSISTIFK